MRSQLVVRLGVQTPQISHLPPDVVSLAAAQEAIDLADAYGVCDGVPLDESQRITLRAALGERADGSWAASRVADFGPRQGTGKTDKIAARELAGLILFGERLQIHTAHEFPTCNEAFLRMAAIWTNWDDLRRRVARIRYANGEQGIELLSGQRLKYRARTGGSGRGFAKSDLIVYDEAQHLGREHLAASGPSKLANPNSQTWYAGSGGLATSAVAWKIRRDALAGDAGRLAYNEHTAEKVSLLGGRVVSERPESDDRVAWYEAMPGLGRWVTEESMESLYDELGAEAFAREGLCVWDPEPGIDGGVIDAEKWAACRDENSKPSGPVSFAIDVSPERSWGSIAVAGGLHVEITGDDEIFDYRPGTHWIVARAKRLQEKWGGKVAVAVGSPAWSLEEDLRAAKVEIVEVSPAQHAQACGDLFDDIETGRLRHIGQRALNAAVAGADKAPYSRDAWLWSRRTSSVDISPLVAVTLAHWVAQKRKRKPGIL
jgi:hypothetical protein